MPTSITCSTATSSTRSTRRSRRRRPISSCGPPTCCRAGCSKSAGSSNFRKGGIPRIIEGGNRRRAMVRGAQTMTRFTQIIFAAVAAVLGAATAGQAQTIAGTVRDATGAVMPGVTVEAASPALIEKVRSAASDGAGQYRIVNLSPGIYTVTFALAGFTSVKREGIELTGNFTATINAEMRLGTLEETITVSGVTPLVDVQSVTKQTVFTR